MTVDQYALTTLASAKTYMGYGAGTEADAFIESLIDQATVLMETYCDRKLKSRAFTQERYDGTGLNTIVLLQWPIISVGAISVGQVQAITVKNTATDTTAFVSVSSTGVTLTKDGTETELLFADYLTMTLLADAITATGTFTGTVVSDYASFKSDQLVAVNNLYCLDVDANLNIPNPSGYLSDYSVNASIGELCFPGNTGQGYQNIFITYTAGYATIPDDLVLACNMQVNWMRKQSGENLGLLGQNRRHFDDGSATYSGQAILPSIQSTLDRYKKDWI